MTFATRKCPHCDKPIVVRVVTPQSQIRVVLSTPTEYRASNLSIAERIMRTLDRGTARGLTIREMLQGALKGTPAALVLDTLLYDLLPTNRVVDARRGKAMYYISKEVLERHMERVRG